MSSSSPETEFTLPRVKNGVDATAIDVDTIKLEKIDVVTTARTVFHAGRTRDLKFRRKQLKNLLRMCDEHKDDMLVALKKDLCMSTQEALVFEIEFIKNDIKNLLYNFESWSKPSHRYRRVMNFFDDLKIYKDPYGVILIFGHWNFPLHTCILPLAGAMAAGNCCVLKPSSKPSACHDFLVTYLPNYLDSDCYHVLQGGETETRKMLEEKFDYIFYSGNCDEAKYLHQVAARTLTPTTFILGGKNPVYLDDTANLETAAKRILWGKCINAGQTSIAPEYLLCTQEVQSMFVDVASKILKEWYGSDPKHSPDFGRMVTQEHYDKAVMMMKDKKVAYGGYTDPTTRFIHPTILVDISPNDAIMHEEISSPILPIITIHNLNEAITFINARDKPLCLYIFSKNTKDVNMLLGKTSSGGVTVNDTILHAAAESLPIGGVGMSGMGNYRGKASFETFTHHKSVLKKPLNFLVEKVEAVRYPPYSEYKQNVVVHVMRKMHPFPIWFVYYLFAFLLGVIVAVIFFHIVPK